MNKIIIIGNLTGDPAIRTTRDGISVCDFTVAVNGRRKEDPAQFFRVSVWRQMGENCHKYLAKGRKVSVIGEIQTRSYDAKDGTKRYITEIVADEVEFLTPKGQDSGSGSYERAYDRQSAPQAPEGFTEIDDDQLPF